MELAIRATGIAGSRSIHANPLQLFRASLSESEIQFLEYRLHVLESWPASRRKDATIGGILLRLNALRGPRTPKH
jgi:hypothetical protein